MIIGLLIKVLTIPGLVLDAFINKLICNYLKIPVYQVNYFPIIEEKEAAVVHEIPKDFTKTYGIAILPFIIMSCIAIIIFYVGLNFFPDQDILFIWLGVSVAAHSFPFIDIADLLWNKSVAEIKKGNYFAIAGFPLVIVIYIARGLHYFWLDIIYGLLLYFLVKGEV